MAKPLFLVVLCITALGPTACCFHIGECQKPERKTALFIFGDSLFDVGNNNYINTTTLDQANFWPYGETYFKLPTGRFSDGRLITDFIATYAKLPLLPPFLQPGGSQHSYYDGANFASAGAGALVQTFQGSVINMEAQLKYFKKVKTWLRNKIGKSKSAKILSNAVYLFSVGTNDYLSLFVTNSTVQDSPQYVQMVLGNLTAIVKEIHKIGGRKFGFLNLGDLGCLPGLRILNPSSKNGCLEKASNLAKLHNIELYNILSRMEKELKGFKYSLYDFNSNVRERMDHPSKYGLKEGKIACCGKGQYRGIFSCGGKRPVGHEFELCQNPSMHVFWDSYHQTETIYQQMAAEMWNGPSNFKSLFQCL
ncbi:GDSL esterase/lipase 5-like [Nicotiana tomentosiformis]|uniref:GDSL esterase/lipase 5-like n=1 Tax=Nicotiana tomentosiformis TaxID=4098 RepID=UPI00051B8D3F|nr:GDSL esterase/lipase 5-like [Nicotiana tomentosiformis]